DATGAPDAALPLLARAEHEARALGQRLDAAIAAYQRGVRVGGDEGARLVLLAQRDVAALGAHMRVLEEDRGRRR
ncbi:hypothetical protein L6R52_05810, partial [Myxococcota bacterium]|nr:hypothetical protein [Myxococcota bacterium]